MYVSETQITVRYAETDQMGIVHHSNYVIWFEAGRTDFIRKLGLPYSQMEEKGLLLPVIEVICRYKSSARYEDVLIIKTSIREFTGVRVILHYEVVHSGNNRVIAEGETVHVFTTKDLQPVNLKKFLPDIYEMFNREI